MNFRIQLLSLFGVTVVFAGLACTDSNFKGGARNEQPPQGAPVIGAKPSYGPTQPLPPGTELLKFGCPDPLAGSAATATVRGSAGGMIKVEGEFCPASAGVLTVLFVVDFSQSMHDNDPSFLFGCGRLRAAQAIVNRITAGIPQSSQASVTAGVVSFSRSAGVAVPLGDIRGFAGALSSANFCGEDGGTNYAAAFDTAANLLALVQGPKVLYFISDGEPNVNGGQGQPDFQAQSDGLASASRLRSIPDLTFNALFLQPSSFTVGFDPLQYLTQVVGSPDRVRIAGNAESLATEIVQLALPALQIVGGTERIEVRADAIGQNQQVSLAQFGPHPTRPGAYIFATQPFKAFGTPGQEIENAISISAQDSQGR